jgi:hypothetical protein
MVSSPSPDTERIAIEARIEAARTTIHEMSLVRNRKGSSRPAKSRGNRSSADPQSRRNVSDRPRRAPTPPPRGTEATRTRPRAVPPTHADDPPTPPTVLPAPGAIVARRCTLAL